MLCHQTADVTITHSQTPGEKGLGLARLFVAGGRRDADKFQVLISQCYPIGQFCVSSHPMVSTYFNEVDEWIGDSDEEE